MLKKKKFILEIPFFLASPAGNISARGVYAFCYVLLIIGYYTVPLLGSVLASLVCLVIWQFFNVFTKYDTKYRRYNKFLLQRIVFCLLMTFCVFGYSLKSGELDYSLWLLWISVLAIINVSDVLLSLKGMIGIGYIKKWH